MYILVHTCTCTVAHIVNVHVCTGPLTRLDHPVFVTSTPGPEPQEEPVCRDEKGDEREGHWRYRGYTGHEEQAQTQSSTNREMTTN